MSYKILTVNREFESGGSEIAQAVAERLSLPYYDRFLIINAAENSGVQLNSAEASDEKLASRFEYSRAQAAYYYTAEGSPLPTNARIAFAQFDLIRQVAAEGPCLIVGRCADNILRKEGLNVASVFICASPETRLQRTMQSLNISESEAARVLRQTDKSRRAYYKNYTGRELNDPYHYSMVLNTDLVSFDECVELICTLYGSGQA